MVRRLGKRRSLAGARRRAGFTLIELIVVLAVIGILAATSLPNLVTLVHRARRTEAREALKGIYATQLAYQAETGGFADTFDELGFELDAGKRVDERTIRGPYYTYTLTALEVSGSPRANFRAVATGDIDPGDPFLDILLIENRLLVLGGSG